MWRYIVAGVVGAVAALAGGYLFLVWAFRDATKKW